MLDRLFPDEPNRARYLPAISHQFAIFAALPQFQFAGFTSNDLDYLSRSSLFRYPVGLSSAGQAIQKSGAVRQRRTMVSQRNRANTFIITDSGGFQVQQGTIEWYPEGHSRDTVATVLDWQEANADFVMALDFPTGGIGNGNMLKHMRALEAEGVPLRQWSNGSGLSRAYHACLEHTIRNTVRMLNLRQQKGATTGFLSVLQGRNEEESRHWYEATHKLIQQSDGIAFAGTGRSDFSLMLARLMDMKRDGLLNRRLRHIHVLGTGTLMAGVLLTCLQRNLRLHTDAKEIQITYDTATPFQAANRYYEAFTHFYRDKEALQIPPGLQLGEAERDEHTLSLNEWCWHRTRDLFEADRPRDGLLRAESGVGDKAKVHDIFYTTKHGPHRKPKPTWPGALLLTLHNVDVTVRAQRAAINAYLENRTDVLTLNVRSIAGLIDHAFNPARGASLLAASRGYSENSARRYAASFNVHRYLANYAGTLQGLL